MSRPHSEERGARARAARRSERRLRHLKDLAHAVAVTQSLADETGAARQDALVTAAEAAMSAVEEVRAVG